MSNRKFLSDLSAGTAQAILSQCAGIVVFLLLSRWLDKSALGQVNWITALLLVIFTAAGFGLDHITVRKISTGSDPSAIVSLYGMHVMVFSLLLALPLALVPFFRSSVPVPVFFLLAAAQAAAFLANPFRPVANGLQRFGLFFWMSSSASLLKLVLLVIVGLFGGISPVGVAIIYFAASLAELIVCLFIYRFVLRQPLRLRFRFRDYGALLSESFPVFCTGVLNTAIGRMDWLLLGISSGAIAVAEYSFVNRVFELASLPLFAIAPILFPQIAKRFGGTDGTGSDTLCQVNALIRTEAVIAVWIALLLNICWDPVMDSLTNKKYGHEVSSILHILSLALPLVYLNNVFWSILFARQRLRMILYVFLTGFLVNLSLNIVLVRFYGVDGAAIALLVTLLVQYLLYLLLARLPGTTATSFRMIPVALIAWVVFRLATGIPVAWVWQAIIASLVYGCLLLITGLISRSDWAGIHKILSA